MTYKHENPCDNGGVEFKLSKRKLKEILNRRKISWSEKCRFYIFDDRIEIYWLTPVYVKILAVVLFPVWILIAGIGNINQLLKEYGDMFHEVERGKFVKDTIWRRHDIYDEIANAAGIIPPKPIWNSSNE